MLHGVPTMIPLARCLALVAVLSVHPASAQTLPSPWATRDVGTVSATGTANGSAGSFTVQGGGADIWSQADAFRFVYRVLTGDGTIAARVTTLDHTHEWAKAGVMLRETLAASSTHASMIVSAGRGLAFQRRVSTGGLSTHTAGGGGQAPSWVRLVRKGSTVTAQTSVDGVAWSTVGSQSISMAATIYAGLAVTSHDDRVTTSAQFEGVSFSSGAAAAALARQPFLQQVTSSSASVVWTTFSLATSEVRHGIPGGPTSTTRALSTLYPAWMTGLGYDYYQHEARLGGLAPATIYQYDILAGGVAATDGTDRFRTAPPAGDGTVRFIAFGDSGTGSTAQRQLATVMAADTFDLALHTGDIAYGTSTGIGDGTFQALNDWFFAMYERWLRRAPMFPSMGNHDSRAGTEHGTHYLESFVLPENGASTRYPDHAERYYSFDYGPVHVVALDTELAFQDTARRAEQLDWLDADLAATSQPWKVAYFHRSPFTSGGGHGSDLAVRRAFSPVFERHGLQLVLSAHEHVYERSRPIGPLTGRVVYVVTGGGGGPLYPNGSSEWTEHSASVHHYVRAQATSCLLTVEAVGLSGGVFDRTTLDRCGTGDTSSGLPAGWASRDIGAVGVAGTVSTSGGTVTVRGAGADVWGTSDAFHYAYGTLAGDGTIVARVTGLSGTHAWTKVGVMMRASTAADSPHAFMLLSRDRGLAFQRRTTKGGISTHTAGASVTAPHWVRLARTGSTFTASVSSDGTSWSIVGHETIAMPGSILVGLAVTNHDASALATGRFESVGGTGW